MKHASQLLAEDFANLRTWIDDDAPVAEPSQDRFGYDAIARRIASRLAADPNSSSTAIVGALGSGKSTAASLVRYHLVRSPARSRTRFVLTSIWHFDTTEAVVRGILDALVSSLQREVSVPHLSRLPAEYAGAIEGVSSAWGTFASALTTPKDPATTLQAFNRAALASGLTFVLWIEDMERFAGTRSETSAYEERIAPIRGLLYLLDQLETVTVVIASTTVRMRFDVEKIARFVERLPANDEAQVARVIATFRTGCLSELAGMIDPADSKERGAFAGDDTDASTWLRGDSAHFPSPLFALAALARTPRALKFGLRHTYAQWALLRGEIDFDELLTMSFIRAVDPDVFALVDDYFDILRQGDRVWSPDGTKPSPFGARLASLLKKRDVRYQKAMRDALEVVFGPLKQPAPRPEKHPQGMAVRAHADYWKRFMSGLGPEPARSDQTLLLLIRTALSLNPPDLTSLVPLFEDNSLWRALEVFAPEFETSHLAVLLRLIVEARAGEDFAAWPRDAFGQPEPPGVLELHHLAMVLLDRERLDQGVLRKAIEDAYEFAFPKNLWLVDDIEHWFVTGSSSGEAYDRRLLGDKAGEMRERFRALLVEHYQGKPDALAAALAGLPSYTLARLCWDLSRIRSRDFSSLPFVGWADFAVTLVEAGRTFPEVMLPQIADLVVRTIDMSDGNSRYEYDRELGAILFAEGVLGTLFAAYSGVDARPTAVRRAVVPESA